MPRLSYPAPSLAVTVQAHFALTYAELARFMGVSRALVAAVEAGRKDFSDSTHAWRARTPHLGRSHAGPRSRWPLTGPPAP